MENKNGSGGVYAAEKIEKKRLRKVSVISGVSNKCDAGRNVHEFDWKWDMFSCWSRILDDSLR